MPGDLVLPFRIAAAALPPYLSASGGQLFIALRATAESLRCAAFTCVALAPCSFACRKGVRSHPLRGAYRACCAGLKRPFSYMVGVLGFEPRTSSLSGTRSNQLSYTPIQDYQSLSGCGLVKWWSRRDSNPQHPACKAGALAIELRPRSHVVSPSGILT